MGWGPPGPSGGWGLCSAYLTMASSHLSSTSGLTIQLLETHPSFIPTDHCPTRCHLPAPGRTAWCLGTSKVRRWAMFEESTSLASPLVEAWDLLAG